MYKAVIFDLDGTLLNTIDDLADAGNHVLSVLGFPVHSTAQYKIMVGNGIPVLVERMLPETARGAATHAVALSMFLRYYAQHSADRTAPYDGILSLLETLRAQGKLIGVVSNKDDTLAKQVIAQYFPHTFHAVGGHIPGTLPKPDPTLVDAMRRTFALECSEVLYVGDSNVDIFTAQNAGLDSCGVLWGFRSAEELSLAGATYLAENPQQLLEIIL